jgi:hypothetical protein
MNLLSSLVSGPNLFHGEGVNEENEAFVGELRIQVLEGGRAALLSYVATLSTGKIVHIESSLLGIGPTGRLCLWPVMFEIPVILPHQELTTEAGPRGGVKAVFGSGPRDEAASFREEITVQINADRSLVYAHAWGLPGGAFEDRSLCHMVPSAA